MRTMVFSGLAVLGMVAVAAGLTALDHFAEEAGGTSDLALDFIDRLLLIGSAVGATLVILRMARLRERTTDIEARLERAASEGRAWRTQSRKFVDGLTRAIETQFDLWGLSPAEADVAGLLLKGASVREIATLRRTSEATIRQQAQRIYRKSGLSSRSELSAYFLEDLFALSEATLMPTHRTAEDRYDA